MERLIISKLILISQNESSSLEIPFRRGLNIILGGNKTGKSSIIKSIFTTFGCECKHIEADWKNLISSSIIFFKYGNNNYCILREGKEFSIFEEQQNAYTCLINTEEYHGYSNFLMELFDVRMPCVMKKGNKEINITPPLLFRFQYIDQDDGWSKIGDSFSNVKYIKDWVPNTNKYVSGYLNEEYYSLRADKAKKEATRDEVKLELHHNEQFVEKISINFKEIPVIENPEKVESDLNHLIVILENDKKTQIELREQIGIVENNIFLYQHQLHMIESSLDETYADIEYAMDQDEIINCPTCGAQYNNRLSEQLDISTDYSLNEKLLKSTTEELQIEITKLEKIKSEFVNVKERMVETQAKIRNAKELLSYSTFYRNKGKRELYDSCLLELSELQGKLEAELTKIVQVDEEIEALKSKKRSTKIRKEIENCCYQMAELVAISKNSIKLRDFVQVINNTGSDTPRIVYMYQTALYNYNLKRIASPFNFLVIDTPNQQGQDDENLNNIHQSLNNFLSTNGQVILGTERETGVESVASNVIRLEEKRRCLKSNNYNEHVELLRLLYSEVRNLKQKSKELELVKV